MGPPDNIWGWPSCTYSALCDCTILQVSAPDFPGQLVFIEKYWYEIKTSISRQVNIYPPDNNSVKQIKVSPVPTTRYSWNVIRLSLALYITENSRNSYSLFNTRITFLRSCDLVLLEPSGTFWHVLFVFYFYIVLAVLLIQLVPWSPMYFEHPVQGIIQTKDGDVCIFVEMRWMGNIEY